MKNNKRNLSVEYLRVFFMFLIVQLHVMQYGYGEETIINDTSMNSYVQLSLIVIGKLGVPGFIFISGYYGVKLKWEKIVSLWFQTSFYAMLSVLLFFIIERVFNLKECLGIFVSIFYKWWFIEYYVLLMLLSPILNKGIEFLTQKKYALIIAVIIFYIYAVLWFNARNSACSLLQFISIYLIGRYLALFPIKWLEKYSIFVCVISVVLLIFFTDIVHFFGKNSLIKYIITYYNILVLIAVVSLFMACNKYVILGKGNFVTQNCLAVYLIHSTGFFFILLMEKIWPNIPFNLFLSIGGIAIIILICSLMEEGRKTLFGKLEVRLIDKIAILIGNNKNNS